MSDQHNPYEDACEAYESSLVAQGYNCGFVEDDAGFDAAHSIAIGAAVEAAVMAERERVLAEVERLRTVLDSEESALRQLSEWLRGKESGT